MLIKNLDHFTEFKRKFVFIGTVSNTINGKALPPPKVICDLIKKGVTIRNSIAHIGGNPPSDETVDEILGAIRDIIWLLDYYCGHKWAYDFISKDIRAELEQQ